MKYINQGFHARIFSKNLMVMLALPTRQDIERNTEDKLYQYLQRSKAAIGKMACIATIKHKKTLDTKLND